MFRAGLWNPALTAEGAALAAAKSAKSASQHHHGGGGGERGERGGGGGDGLDDDEEVVSATGPLERFTYDGYAPYWFRETGSLQGCTLHVIHLDHRGLLRRPRAVHNDGCA